MEEQSGFQLIQVGLVPLGQVLHLRRQLPDRLLHLPALDHQLLLVVILHVPLKLFKLGPQRVVLPLLIMIDQLLDLKCFLLVEDFLDHTVEGLGALTKNKKL